MDNQALFAWRLHNDIAGMPEGVADYIDTVAEFCPKFDEYFRYALNHTCDLFDVGTMLAWLETQKLVSESDRKLWKLAVETIEARRTPFLTGEQVKQRLAAAGGDCPLCGCRISYMNDKGTFRTIGHCYHFKVSSFTDISFLSTASAWEGQRWPWILGIQIGNTDGQPVGGTLRLSPHCRFCRHETAIRVLKPRVVAVLTDLVKAGRRAEFYGLGSSPTSYLECRWGCQQGDQLCSHVQHDIERLADDVLHSDNHEFRLNGAGLKMQSCGVYVGFCKGTVTFQVRVSPVDQAKDYPAFFQYANDAFRAAGIFEFDTTAGSK